MTDTNMPSLGNKRWALVPTTCASGATSKAFPIDSHGEHEPDLEYRLSKAFLEPTNKEMWNSALTIRPLDSEPSTNVEEYKSVHTWTRVFRNACIGATADMNLSNGEQIGTSKSSGRLEVCASLKGGIDVTIDNMQATLALGTKMYVDGTYEYLSGGLADDWPPWCLWHFKLSASENVSAARHDAALTALQRGLEKVAAPNFSPCNTGLDVRRELERTLKAAAEVLTRTAARYTYRETETDEEYKARMAAVREDKQSRASRSVADVESWMHGVCASEGY